MDYSKYNIDKIKNIIIKEHYADDSNNYLKIDEKTWEYLISEIIKTYENMEKILHDKLIVLIKELENNILDNYNDKKINKNLMEYYMLKLGEIKDCKIIIKDILI